MTSPGFTKEQRRELRESCGLTVAQVEALQTALPSIESDLKRKPYTEAHGADVAERLAEGRRAVGTLMKLLVEQPTETDIGRSAREMLQVPIAVGWSDEARALFVQALPLLDQFIEVAESQHVRWRRQPRQGSKGFVVEKVLNACRAQRPAVAVDRAMAHVPTTARWSCRRGGGRG